MIESQQIAAFLRQNPDFFEQHPDLLPAIEPTVDAGAVSLQGKQMEVLRAKQQTYQNQLKSFVEMARSNENIERRMHSIALDLVAYRRHDAVQTAQLDYMLDCIKRRFEVEFSVIFIADELDSTIPNNLYTDLVARVGHQRSVCDDRLSSDLLQQLFRKQAQQIKSCAFVPVIQTAKVRGVLVLGACDIARFDPKLGSVYLDRLGQLLGAWYA